MRQAIVTKYLGPTNNRGARIVAKAGGGARAYAKRMVIAWDYALDVADNHRMAATELARKLNWLEPGNGQKYKYVGGSMPDDTGYCFVQVEAGR
jgi:hypothetical protein